MFSSHFYFIYFPLHSFSFHLLFYLFIYILFTNYLFIFYFIYLVFYHRILINSNSFFFFFLLVISNRGVFYSLAVRSLYPNSFVVAYPSSFIHIHLLTVHNFQSHGFDYLYYKSMLFLICDILHLAI